MDYGLHGFQLVNYVLDELGNADLSTMDLGFGTWGLWDFEIKVPRTQSSIGGATNTRCAIFDIQRSHVFDISTQPC